MYSSSDGVCIETSGCVAAEKLRAFDADGPIAKRGAFSGAGGDSDMGGHAVNVSIERRPVRLEAPALGNPDREMLEADVAQRARIERLEFGVLPALGQSAARRASNLGRSRRIS